MSVQVLQGDCMALLPTLAPASVQCVVTSPPYFALRSYLPDDHPDKASEMGSESSPEIFIATLVNVFREVKRVLRNDGTAFLNLGDSYVSGQGGRQSAVGELPRDQIIGRAEPRARDDVNVAGWAHRAVAPRFFPGRETGWKPKDLMMMPARVAIALQADGWYLRSQMPWVKRSCMPESITDRPASAIEYVFLLTKSPKYFWDAEAVSRQGAIPAGTLAGKASAKRSGAAGVNSRPAEYATYTGRRNSRNSDLFFDSLDGPHGLICDADGEPIALDVNTAAFSESHFATFPPNLIAPLIKAGTSERGCCAACGAPWVRETERKVAMCGGSGRAGHKPVGKGAGGTQTESGEYDIRLGPVVSTVTTGWSASCQCDAPVVPCAVLDPFGGAGTTGLVADRLGRNATLIELNPEYAAMARARVNRDAGLFAEVT